MALLLHLITYGAWSTKQIKTKTKGGLMAEELKAGYARPTGGPVGETVPENIPEIKDEKKYR